MTHPLTRTAALALGAAVLTLTGGPATAAPACDDAVTGALHTVHETTGDPGGVIHRAEETYCSVG